MAPPLGPDDGLIFVGRDLLAISLPLRTLLVTEFQRRSSPQTLDCRPQRSNSNHLHISTVDYSAEFALPATNERNFKEKCLVLFH